MCLEDVTDRLGVNERYVRRLIAERRLPYLKIGHLIRFDPNDIEHWIAKARVAAVEFGPYIHR
jgi:excisionase family DNA binding protein